MNIKVFEKPNYNLRLNLYNQCYGVLINSLNISNIKAVFMAKKVEFGLDWDS